jgi:uncharacterized RDD family membrane protein YckC
VPEAGPNERAADHDRGQEATHAHAQSYASVGRRLAAYLLDLPIAILSVIVPVYLIMLFLIATGAWVPAKEEEPWSSHGYIITIAFFLSTGPVYFVLCHASPWQATLGKRLLNIYVTGDDGKRISLARSFVRGLTLWFFNAFAVALISVITIAASEKRKAVHDFVAQTLVRTGRPVPGGALEPWRIAAFIGFPVAWMVGTFLATM